jgi:hypothetical protein
MTYLKWRFSVKQTVSRNSCIQAKEPTRLLLMAAASDSVKDANLGQRLLFFIGGDDFTAFPDLSTV